MNIFVTGGAGYIGSAAAEALLKAKHSVTVFDSLITGHRAAVPHEAVEERLLTAHPAGK